ncbi:hypothetical protein [Streptomyces zaomyceticus]|uniref:hypothetical protein n=1 Tax=Streptomyces zaomyceticus TaxID=68286 RepID=UPI002E1C169A
MTATPQAPRSFADVLNLLLQAQAKEDPKNPGSFLDLTNDAIAEAINAKAGRAAITGEGVRRLRRGVTKSPSVDTASLFADFFGLPLDVFRSTDSEIATKVVEEVQRFVGDKRRTLREDQEPPTVAVLARTTRRLSPQGQARVARYAKQVEQLEAMENDALPRVDPAD